MCITLLYQRTYMSSNLVVTTKTFFKVNVSSVYVANSVSCFHPYVCGYLVFLFLISIILLNLFCFHLQFALGLDSISFPQMVKLKHCFVFFIGHMDTPFQGHAPIQVLACFQLTLISSPFGLWKSIFCFCFVA